MKRTALAFLAAFVLSPAHAQERTVTFGYLADPSHEAALYAMREGLVTSDTIEVEAQPLDIPALIQATAARTYDVIETAAMAIPRGNARGLELEIIGVGLRYHESGQGADIWVDADSDIESIEDLEGRRLAVYSIGSAGITLIRIAMANAWDFDVATTGGSVEFVEMPAPAMPAALASGNVDAATLIHAQAYEAMQTGDFRSIAKAGEALTEEFGVRMVSAVLAGYSDKLAADPEVYQEFLRLVRASVDYALENPDEVFAAVGEQEGIDPQFFETWFSSFSSIPVLVSDQDIEAIDILWREAKELGVLEEEVEPAEDAVWADTVRETE
ncbi:ABC transporter substrate-binding protein [Pararhizobium haloflavum]|uniref:ABC transporter substrate-binding protein n=1 Tax=Pararhizobium haloflavum TaxID=2037914 RepID=UPI001300137D|nr:MqnA/MqnD/SBP family protein [Pararhizobium haloflavum]